MRLIFRISSIGSLAIAAAACGQSGSDNVMAPEANALEPADVNASLGPDITTTSPANVTDDEARNEANSVANDNGPAYPPDEPGAPGNKQ